MGSCFELLVHFIPGLFAGLGPVQAEILCRPFTEPPGPVGWISHFIDSADLEMLVSTNSSACCSEVSLWCSRSWRTNKFRKILMNSQFTEWKADGELVIGAWVDRFPLCGGRTFLHQSRLSSRSLWFRFHFRATRSVWESVMISVTHSHLLAFRPSLLVSTRASPADGGGSETRRAVMTNVSMSSPALSACHCRGNAITARVAFLPLRQQSGVGVMPFAGHIGQGLWCHFLEKSPSSCCCTLICRC